MKKWKEKHRQQDITTTRISCEENDEEESIITLDGGFKVLKILKIKVNAVAILVSNRKFSLVNI